MIDRLIYVIFVNDSYMKDIALTVLRIGIGIIFMKHGSAKLFGGIKSWHWLGNQMGNLGITFAPLFWGFMAAISEFFGGLSFILGFGIRISALFLICVMLVAIAMHYTQGDSWIKISYPISMLLVFITFLIAGAGPYSLSAYFDFL